MTVDFFHNQIIRDTVTEKFIASFNENLLPELKSIYGQSLLSLSFYEDHIADGYRISGVFYYPLTVLTDDGAEIRWISWQVANYRHYDKFNPYSYKGAEPLSFDAYAEPPAEILEKQQGRAISFEGNMLPVTVSAPVEDKTFLSGKYSQRFVDELSAQITARLEAEISVLGLSESGVELVIPFAPGSFLEHVVGNTTYRRVLIKARGCSARDLWIKWTRVDKNGTYTVADSVNSSEIFFELAEDVPGKIKEKEYRYLVKSSLADYQNAVSRKNITAWREMMRRVIKRGEVIKADNAQISLPAAPASAEPVIESPIAAEPAATPVVTESVTDRLSKILADIDDEKDEDEEEINSDLTDLLKSAIGMNKTPAVSVKVEPYEPEATETEAVEETEAYAEDTVEEPAVATETDEQPIEAPVSEDYEARLRRELEAKLRAEMEEELRAKAKEAEELRARLDAQLKAEAREKQLMAEAAQAALSEQRRIEAEREAERARQRADEERLMEARRKAEEEKRLAEEARAKAEAEARAKEAEQAPTASGEVKYVSKTARLIFKYSVAQTATKKIHEIILATIKYFHKEDVYIRIKATVPDANTVVLDFVKIPENEIPLIVNIIKVLGKSDLGIIKAILD